VCDAPTKVFTPTCGTAGCHDATSTFGNFGGGDAAARSVVDKPGVEARCTDKFIDSANPQASLIYTMTLDTPPQGCFPSPMPLNLPALSDSDTACIVSWLSQF